MTLDCNQMQCFTIKYYGYCAGSCQHISKHWNKDYSRSAQPDLIKEAYVHIDQARRDTSFAQRK